MMIRPGISHIARSLRLAGWRRGWVALTLFISFTALARAHGAGGGDRVYWQLTLAYTTDTLAVRAATEIPPLRKRVQTPGLYGAPVRINCAVDWLDAAGGVLATTTAELPLGQREAPGVAAPAGVTTPVAYVPNSGVFVIRLLGPRLTARPASLRLHPVGTVKLQSLANDLPPVFRRPDLLLPLQRLKSAGQPTLAAAGPLRAEKIRDNGPDDNRLVLVILGDGYTQDDLSTGLFTLIAEYTAEVFDSVSPWSAIARGLNIYRIDVESNESGADRMASATSPLVDTWFNASFWSYGIERLLALDDAGQERAIAAADQLVGAGQWDYLLVNVNSGKYGGSGGSLLVFSSHDSAGEIMIHELGHTFGRLADEYGDPTPGYPPGDSEPNVDYDYSGPELKWHDWVDAGTPLPTPDMPDWEGVVGAFEGARYTPTGIYRPCRNCRMRTLGYPFCPICKEAHLLEFFDTVRLADSIEPATDTAVNIARHPAFTVHPLPIDGIGVEWSLNGQPLPDATQPALNLTVSQVGDSTSTLVARVSYPTPLVRTRPIAKTYQWTVYAQSGDNAVGAAWRRYP